MATLNQIVTRLNDIADSHLMINSFAFGEINEVGFKDNLNRYQYPLMFLQHNTNSITGQQLERAFTVFIMDIPKKAEIDETEVLSDMEGIALDVISILHDPTFYSADWGLAYVDEQAGVNMTPFTERFQDTLAGFAIDLTIIDVANTRCDSPLDTNLNCAPFVSTKSLLLDGVDECVEFDDFLTLRASDTVGTIAAWVKVSDNMPAAAEIIFATASGATADDFMQIILLSSGQLRAQIADAGTNQWVVETDGVALLNNQWHNIAVVQDGVTPVIYVDGLAVAQTTAVSLDTTIWLSGLAEIDNARIGCRTYNGADLSFYSGQISQFDYWDDALAAVEVDTLYNAGTPIDPAMDSGPYVSAANHQWAFRFGDDPDDAFVTEWTFDNSAGGGSGVTVNAEFADIVTDAP